MTATTNGASLEDCLTNIFSLIDLNGIRWKRFRHKENQSHHHTHHSNNYLYTPIDTHPILTTYAKCIEENHIAVWRHEPQKRPHNSGQGGGGQPQSGGGHSNFPTPTRTSNNNTPTSAGPTTANNNVSTSSTSSSSNNNQNNYELWIFGYGNQLKVDNVINGDELIEVEDDTWESKGLSYECRTLLFKALHNLIERCLISKGFTKIGRWFVQPISENNLPNISSDSMFDNNGKATKHSRLMEQKNSIRTSIHRIINDGLRHTSSRLSSTYFTSSLDGFKSSLSFAFSFFVHGDSTICATVDVRQHPLIHPLTRTDLAKFQEGEIVRVALAPFGLNGILNGISYKDSDNGAATSTFIQQWSKFYPLPQTLARLVPCNKYSNNNGAITNSSTSSNQYTNDGSRAYLSNLTNMLLFPQSKPFMYFNHEPDEVPPVVEVIVAGYRMRYPTECIFTTSKVVDIYRSLNNPTQIPRSNTLNTKRLNKNSCSIKPNNKLHEKFNEEKRELTKVKIEPDSVKDQSNFNSPFKLSSTTSSSTITTINESNNKQTIPIKTLDGKTTNGLDNSDNSSNNNHNNNNSSSNHTMLMSRYNSAKVGFGINSISSLGPSDIGKIYPTPPSLEQMILSPTNNTEETAQKETTILSPEVIKDNGIDVYKPVECALMPPPPKWAALTNIIISSSKSLPPECVYKGSSQSQTLNLKPSIKGNYKLSKHLNQSVNSPLTDQTNKSISSPKTPISISLLSNAPMSQTTANTNATTATITTFSSFTSPHQRLFNNLQEVNSIQLNLLISDSALGMFKDHNFESCTLCVCNMSIKGTQTDTIPQKLDNSSTTPHWRPSMGSSDTLLGSSLSGEYINECTCGFSAMTNRHCSHLSGLFLEDELELTNVLYDPTEMIDQNKLFRKTRLSNYPENSYSDEQKIMSKLFQEQKSNNTNENSEDNSKVNLKATDKLSKDDKPSQVSHSIFEETRIFVIDQLKQQCSSIIHSNSSLSKVLLIESFRNNRHLMSCSNYYAQATTNNSSTINNSGPFSKFLDETNKYTTVKMMNRNPVSLKFSDFCELTKGIITKLGNQSSQQSSRLANTLVKPSIGNNSFGSGNGLASIFSRMFSNNNRQTSLLGKSSDSHTNNRNNIFLQGLQTLVMPTLSIDPKGALHMLEHLVKEESKEALARLNKAILIFTSPIHDWQYLCAPVPENNFDVANLLKIIQPSLDKSIGSHNKLYKDFVHQQQQHIFSARDSPTGAPTLPTPPCQGPLTWRQFHQSAGRGTEDQCEPQPIPSLLVGHHVEKNHLAVSPFALKFWDKLLLEPYTPEHNMFYVIISPNNQNILSHINQFFKELTNTYELMKLGKHVPIGNGLVLTDSNPNLSDNFNESSSKIEQNNNDWFSKCSYNSKDPSNNILARLKSYASKMNSALAKTIVDFIDERQPPYDPHADRFESSPSPQTSTSGPSTTSINTKAPNQLNQQQSRINEPSANRTFNNLLGINNLGGTAQQTSTLSSSGISTNTQSQEMFGYSADGQTTADMSSQSLSKSQSLIGGSGGPNEDNVHQEEEANKQSGIVIYIVDPFSSPSITQNLRTLSTIGLFKCYSMLLDCLPESVKRITQLQLISLDSIISHSRPILNISRVDQLKSLSLNVYSRCRRILTNQATAKSLTGFGPAAALEAFFKTKNAELCATKMFSPPFILAPMKDKQTELGEMFGDRREKSSVLFCSYCITEDQRWLIASVTNDKGEMSETTVININILDRMKRPKTSVKRVALRKLMEFIISVMSDWMNPWRLIIGKLGRVGHGELREWATLMSKRSLLNYSRHLSERCRQCTILPPTETVSILSACLVSLEPDSKLRIMPDQFTSDDRQASFNKCPLSTPEDASTTHILVFPTSASIQSSHANVEDPLVGSGLDDDLLNQFPLEDGIEGLEVEGNMDDLFSSWDDNPTNVSDNISSHHDTMISSSNLQMGSSSIGDNANNQDETLQLLQQPLALGYYISTAKIGQMPNWFWSTSPHLRNSCPLFLKSALHIHMPCVQLSDDLLHSGVGQTRKSHQLDSNLTTDVLRYVLEGYNSLSWLALNPKTYDRQSCLPVHMQNLLQLYHLMESFS